jgi:carbon-monoxide dehydrogenase small subunit
VSTAEVSLRVNGAEQRIAVEPRTTLADALREELDLVGTHLGCEHGVCGSCTVLVDRKPVRACLMLALQCEGMDVTTIEGLAPEGDLHPVQRAFVENFGLQCGFCTPGFIMLVAGGLGLRPDMQDDELIELLSSNLCRCTGYRSILAAARQAAREMRGAQAPEGH